MKVPFNFTTLAAMVLLLNAIQSYSGITQYQTVSKVVLQQESNGTKIYVYTSDNNGKWGTSGCTNNDPSEIFIPAGSISGKEWLSTVLFAKSTGQKIAWEYLDANCSTQIVVKALLVE